MGRLWSSGFELNSVANGMEYEATFQSTPAISTTTVRSGVYSLRTQFAANRGAMNQGYSANTEGDYYFRFYFRYANDPTALKEIAFWRTTAGLSKVSIRMNVGGTLELWNDEDTAQIGSDSAALTVDTWYRIEFRINSSTLASTAIDARIDGVSFASGTIDIADSPGQMILGQGGANDTQDYFYDDIAINDSSGSFQNSWPGEGEIIHLRPNAAGDSMGWTDSLGADDYTEIDEVTPDDGTTMIGESAADTFDVNLDATPAALASDDTINAVQVGVRFSVSSAAGTQPTVVLRIKASASGTTEESSAITFSSTSWFTNAVAAPRNYQLTLYDLPGASTTAWTKTDLDAAQIGARTTNDPTGTAQISTMWLLVDHKPNAGGGGASAVVGGRMMLGVGF